MEDARAHDESVESGCGLDLSVRDGRRLRSLVEFAHKDEQELSMGHGSDRSGARVHLDALGQGDVFDGYLGLAILHLRKFEVWHHVVIFAEMLMAVGLINGQEILLRASQSVPRLSVQELERFMRVVELQHDQSIA